MSVLTDLKNRGIRDVSLVVFDGLKGLPEVVDNACCRPSSRPASTST
jgi:transposase-like protein